ncbi:YkgB family protein [Shewanella sp. D64]|uniref:DUF417 family protein n=1 Tax=unclassified Shewanella TaxID=196818 RepID=UPI0022BA1314|nr:MULTISPECIES: DUF417 family protein [unclassified Shewanella]MEC4727175.1 YkgB family protein [Shewanella sp. D64]MEC4739208.1 YkgB family protein [Shewanella sp. E94]WBJ95549.1 YkgB family protein [Shewanella sp. MTB7]
MKTTNFGYVFGVLGVSLLLLWLGVYKFTLTEAKLIEPLIVNHPLLSWVYQVFSVQTVSNLIGSVEIIVGLGLLVGLKKSWVGLVSGLAAVGIFVVTLSFILTTPDTWKVSDGVLITSFFLLKDWVFLAVAIMVVETNRGILKRYSGDQ